ncbi:Kelch repeat-containing protein [Hibiscus syriacus]|uniref:Kelch repeat-containing protein n=1 Tax=Hibiscus syriacus TaxID=106335 RepID=A0A6A2XZC7_HIBSY|nr:Kelch repeat-containing protein [Hibiscus syriacus]
MQFLTMVPGLPSSGMAQTSTQLWRGRLHVMGGSKENSHTPGLEHWSLAVKDGKALETEWRSEVPIPRGGPHRACVVFKDSHYVIGGQEGDFMAKPGSQIFKCSRRMEVVYSEVCMLDGDMKWKTLPPMPKPDSHIEFAWALVNNSIVIAGGTTEKHPITKKKRFWLEKCFSLILIHCFTVIPDYSITAATICFLKLNKEDTVKLISAEGMKFVIDKEAAMVSQTIRKMLNSPDYPYVPNASVSTLRSHHDRFLHLMISWWFRPSGGSQLVDVINIVPSKYVETLVYGCILSNLFIKLGLDVSLNNPIPLQNQINLTSLKKTDWKQDEETILWVFRPGKQTLGASSSRAAPSSSRSPPPPPAPAADDDPEFQQRMQDIDDHVPDDKPARQEDQMPPYF